MSDGRPLQPLPFRSVAYRRGHANSHSSVALAHRHMFSRDVLNKALLAQPLRNMADAVRLKRNSQVCRDQFIGDDPTLLRIDA